MTSVSSATREVFGNIQPWMQWVFYALMALSCGVLAYRVWLRTKLWRQGQPGGFDPDWRAGLRRLAEFGLAQKRVHRRSLGAVLHGLLFSGFLVLTIGTTLLMVADKGPIYFHRGWYYLFYELTMDVFGVAFCVGCLIAMYRRAFQRPASLGHQTSDWILLSTLLALGVTGLLVEALRLRYAPPPPEIGRWSLAGYALERVLFREFTPETARAWHLGLWWVHVFGVAGFFAGLPVTRFLHALVGPVHIASRPEKPLGVLSPLDLAEVEQTGRMGVQSLEHFSRRELLSLDACMECGRCEEACPAFASGKPLSPKRVVLDLRHTMAQPAPRRSPLLGETVAAETLWACTMCQACVQECPVLIGQADLIHGMRRGLVGEGQISGPPAKAMAHMGKHGNPYGRLKTDRMAWAAGLDVPTVATHPDFEYLLWVGCAAAFDPRAQKVMRALVGLLREAGVDFAVLGREEQCTGDSARRLGDEFLFQQLAQANVQALNQRKVKKIVTACPHCMNTLRNEYPQFGGHWQVSHHSELLEQLLAGGRLPRASASLAAGRGGTVTFHDPCYLARANGQIGAPRAVLAAAGQPLREMPRHGAKTFCCGAGGGRAWFDEPPAQRVSRLRAREASATGARTVATACPFCLNMMTDAMSSLSDSEPAPVLDIAELLAARSQD